MNKKVKRVSGIAGLNSGDLKAAKSPGNAAYAGLQIKSSILSGESGKFIKSGRKLPDLVCFSHLRWDFVYQRPQHLLTRCARDRRVFFVEEPIFGNGSMRLDVQERDN